LDVIGPDMQEKYEYKHYLLKILKGENVRYDPKWNDWAVLPYQFSTMMFYAYANMYRHIKNSIDNGASITPSLHMDLYSLVTSKNYQRCLKVFFDSTKSILQQNLHALSFLTGSVLIKLNIQGHRQLHKFYESILNKYYNPDFKMFGYRRQLPKVFLSPTVTPIYETFFPKTVQKEERKRNNFLLVPGKIGDNSSNPAYSDIEMRSISSIEDEFGSEDEEIYKHASDEKVPIAVYVSSVRMVFESGSQESIDFISSILRCHNKEIFRTKFIQTVLEMKWSEQKKFQIMQAGAYLVYLLVLAGYLVIFFENLIGLLVVLAVGLILSSYDLLQMIRGFNLFWRDVWNYFDLSRLICLVIYTIAYYYERDLQDPILVALTLISFLRGLSFFRLFNETRYIIQLLMHVIIDMKSFAILLTYTTLGFSLVLMVQSDDNDFFEQLKNAFMVNLGDFNTANYDSVSWMIFIVMAVLNLIILLNMLISIIGESFGKVREQSEVADFLQIAAMVLETELVMGKRKGEYKKLFLQICEQESNDEISDPLAHDIKTIKRLLKNLMKKVSSNQ
jgi:hypothetical protein